MSTSTRSIATPTCLLLLGNANLFTNILFTILVPLNPPSQNSKARIYTKRPQTQFRTLLWCFHKHLWQQVSENAQNPHNTFWQMCHWNPLRPSSTQANIRKVQEWTFNFEPSAVQVIISKHICMCTDDGQRHRGRQKEKEAERAKNAWREKRHINT